jgi:hypothetical protein
LHQRKQFRRAQCGATLKRDKADTTKWSVAKIQAHLKSISKQKEFLDGGKKLKLRTEERFLQSILDAALLPRNEKVPEMAEESDNDYGAKVAFDRSQQLSPLVSSCTRITRNRNTVCDVAD